MNERDADRQARKQRRRAYPGEVVRVGAPQPALYAALSVQERLRAMAALCDQQWTLTGRTLQRVPRDQWPGEIYELRRD